MKKYIIIAISLLLAGTLHAQRYEITFNIPKMPDSTVYLAQHYRDGFIFIDSAKVKNRSQSTASVTFAGKGKLERGIYTLVPSHAAKKGWIDFTIDGSQKFSITLTPSKEMVNPVKDIEGSDANVAMFSYIAKVNWAKAQQREIEKQKTSSDPKVKDKAEHDMELLTNVMTEYEKQTIEQNKKYRFFEILAMDQEPVVPEGTKDEVAYYCTHYWDNMNLADHALVRTPDLFNKMSYYFFGVLYHADKDTICKYADMVFSRIGNDTLMLRYFMDYLMPRYYRSTTKVGWDAVWCYLVRQYYLTGKCGWATQADITNKRKTCEFLEKSLIGALGAEIRMADTNQSTDPKDWISSHNFPQKYVILWFWDPDCHHCQEQTATLKILYDSLVTAGNKLFEVYAVGYEADVNKWKKYVREHQLPFVNVGGTNVNIDYQEAYNVHGAPTMIILNEERRIIMNKTLPTKAILPFLKRYEERRKQ